MSKAKSVEAWAIVNPNNEIIFYVHRHKETCEKAIEDNKFYKGYTCIRVTITPTDGENNGN